MKNILLTGFKPFLGESINPSEMLVASIARLNFPNVDTLVLPVEFQKVVAVVEAQLAVNDYDYVIMLGQAGGRQRIGLERVALNWFEAEHPDEAGFKPERGLIAKAAAEVYFTQIDLVALKERISAQNIPVEISLSAGGYVCNYLYYSVQKLLTEKSLHHVKALFVHVPYLPEQIKVQMPEQIKDQMPSLDFSTMQKAILEIIDYLKN